MMKFIFGIEINMEVFYMLIRSLWVCVTRHAQSTQNNQFAIFLHYLKRDVSDELDFLHADKYKGLLQINTMTLMEIVRHSQNSQNNKFSMSLKYFKKEVRDEVDFLHKLQSFLQFDFNTLAIKVSYKVILSFDALKLKSLKSIFVKIELSMDSCSHHQSPRLKSFKSTKFIF